MDPLTMMIISSILTTGFGLLKTNFQQYKEFGQQQQLLNEEQDFTREREDLAYQRSLPSTQMQNFLDAGFNGNLAANAVLGGNGTTASVTGSPQAPTVSSAMNALQSMIGRGGQNLYDAMLKQAEIKNIQANTNKTEVEAGLMPRDYEIRRESADAQIKFWNQSVHKMAFEVGLTQEQTKLVEQQNLYYGRKSEAELDVLKETKNKLIADAKLANEQAKTQENVRQELNARVQLEGQQAAYYDASTGLVNQEAAGQMLENEGKAIDLNWIEQHNLPLTVDAQKYLVGLLNKCEYDEANKFLDAIFQSALNQEYAGQVATPKYNIGLPFGIYGHRDFGIGQNSQFDGVQSIPFWNPQ